MTRDEIIQAVINLDEALSTVIYEVSTAALYDEADLVGEEHIAIENIVFTGEQLNDYIINFLAEVNANGTE